MTRWTAADIASLKARKPSPKPLGTRQRAGKDYGGYVDGQSLMANWEAPTREFRYVPDRKFRADFAWPNRRVLLEINGGVFSAKSGHSGIGGILKDLERGNQASANGWLLLRLTPDQLRKGELTGWLQKLAETIKNPAF